MASNDVRGRIQHRPPYHFRICVLICILGGILKILPACGTSRVSEGTHAKFGPRLPNGLAVKREMTDRRTQTGRQTDLQTKRQTVENFLLCKYKLQKFSVFVCMFVCFLCQPCLSTKTAKGGTGELSYALRSNYFS